MITQLAPDTTGKLIGTSDMKRACKIGQRLTLRELFTARIARVERPDRSTLLLIAGGELYELEV